MYCLSMKSINNTENKIVSFSWAIVYFLLGIAALLGSLNSSDTNGQIYGFAGALYFFFASYILTLSHLAPNGLHWE